MPPIRRPQPAPTAPAVADELVDALDHGHEAVECYDHAARRRAVDRLRRTAARLDRMRRSDAVPPHLRRLAADQRALAVDAADALDALDRRLTHAQVMAALAVTRVRLAHAHADAAR